TRATRDWSSDVCSSDLPADREAPSRQDGGPRRHRQAEGPAEPQDEEEAEEAGEGEGESKGHVRRYRGRPAHEDQEAEARPQPLRSEGRRGGKEGRGGGS